jgi:transcriptional regulator with XRE-family HTH domain
MILNEALRLIRVYHNEKQKTLAQALDISPSHLSEIESGKKQVTVEILAKYSSHFRVPASSLLYFAEQHGAGEGGLKGNPIAAKIVKMLDWVDTITRDREDPDETEVSP